MATGTNVSIDKMLAEAEAKVRASLTEISILVRHDFREQAKSALAAYYANYPPRMYVRTNNLFSGAIDEDMEFGDFTTSNKNSYGGWVHFNSSGMSDYENGNKDVVFSNFMYGIHGRSSIYVEKEPAMKLMEKFQKNYKQTLDKYFVARGFTVN